MCVVPITDCSTIHYLLAYVEIISMNEKSNLKTLRIFVDTESIYCELL
jgi:hypothetical protein